MSEPHKNQRNSNLEILRIIIMIFIVAHHFSVHGCQDIDFALSNMNTYWVYLLGILGKIGVDVFILISAYFMINSKFTLRKFFVLEGEVYFYSVLFFILCSGFLTPGMKISFKMLASIFLPISHNAYWFITDYVMLMILSPFLNKFIKKLSKQSFLKLMIVLLFIWSVLPTFTGKSFDYSNLGGFIILYLIGSFIHLHVNLDRIKTKHLIITFLVAFSLCYILFAAGNILVLIKGVELLKAHWFKSENSIFILIVSVSLFLIFLKRKEFSNKYINYISGSVLGVYLIHDNNLFRPYLWNEILKVSSYYPSRYFVLFSVVSILGIFIACTAVDILRRLTVEKLWIYIIDSKLDGVGGYVNRIFARLENRIDYYLK